MNRCIDDASPNESDVGEAPYLWETPDLTYLRVLPPRCYLSASACAVRGEEPGWFCPFLALSSTL